MIFLDTHVHIYPCYLLAAVFNSLFQNIELHRLQILHLKNSSDPLAGAGIILTERNDCNYYQTLVRNQSLPNEIQANFSIKDETIVGKSGDNSLPIKIYPGRQVSSSERVEILALFYEPQLPENMPLDELIQLVIESGGLPVINWAPGKWLGRRGEFIKELIQSNQKELLLGITTLLPQFFPLPQLVIEGKKHGIHCLGGSDSLPFKGQEVLCGSYGITIPTLTALPDSSSLKEILLSRQYDFLGKRSSIVDVISRIFRNELVRRK